MHDDARRPDDPEPCGEESPRDRSLDRRQFCRLLAGSAVLAATTPWLEGCGRLLDRSAGDGQAGRVTMAPGTTGLPGPASTSTSAPSPASTDDISPTTAVPSPPDLAVVRGDDPERNVRRVIAELGGMERFVGKGATVLLKPNLLAARPPEYAASTNPVVMATLVKLCLEAGASRVTVADRSTASEREAFAVSGIAAAVETAGGTVKYLDDRNFREVEIPRGRSLRSWPLLEDVFQSDVFINVPVAKTHGLTTVTLSMKNLMGIMGGRRSTVHVDIEQKLVDLNTLVKPHLVVLDAYRVLVRNGPTGGSLDDVKARKTVVAGTSQVAVDAYGTRFFGLEPRDVGYLVKAADQGLGEIDLSRLRVAEIKA